MPKRSRDLRPTYRRRSATTRYRKPNYKKRRRFKKRRSLRIPRVFPDRAVVSHKYCAHGYLDLHHTTSTLHTLFRANGMYDPES